MEAYLVLIERAMLLVEHVLLQLHSFCSSLAAVCLWCIARYTACCGVWIGV